MYEQSITRSHRTAFVLVIDQSGSMAGPIHFAGREFSKAEAVTEVTNRLLFELVERARREGEVRDYYDVAVLGYSDRGVVSLLDERTPFLSVSRLAALPVQRSVRTVECRMPDGRSTLRRITTPEWVAPRAAGCTPMHEALSEVRTILERWCADPSHVASFPPVVFHITDGEASDCEERDLLEICERIRRLGTADGGVLLVHIHLASTISHRPLIFPTPYEVEECDRYARLLYDCASPMPEVFLAAIREVRGDLEEPPFRGMGYNASMTELIAVLDIGSISVKIQ